MFTTNCDAVSTNNWLSAASASSPRWCFTVTKTAVPSTTAATSVVTRATRATNVRWGCLRGGGPAGLDNRTVFGVSTGTPDVDAATEPAAGPAALDARRLPAGFGEGFVEAVFSAIYACLGANIRSTQFSAGASVSVPPANTPVPPAGSTNLPL